MTREELLKVVAHNNSFLRSIASVRSTNGKLIEEEKRGRKKRRGEGGKVR